MLTQEQLKERFTYNPDTGLFRNRKSFNTVGGECKGYVRIGISGRTYPAHRLAFLYMVGYFPENDVDHMNRVKSDNRWKNLREVSRQCNLRNSPVRKDSKTGVRGVNVKGLGFGVQMCVNGVVTNLGVYNTIEEAAKVRWNEEVRQGYPNCNTTSSAYQFLKRRGILV